MPCRSTSAVSIVDGRICSDKKIQGMSCFEKESSLFVGIKYARSIPKPDMKPM